MGGTRPGSLHPRNAAGRSLCPSSSSVTQAGSSEWQDKAWCWSQAGSGEGEEGTGTV